MAVYLFQHYYEINNNWISLVRIFSTQIANAYRSGNGI